MMVPRHTEKLLEHLAESLQVPPSRHEAAERSYKAIGEWLHREASCIRAADPKVYIQGSFRLGTAIRPITDKEDYDVDLVCELSLSKTRFSQAQLKTLLGRELRAYAKAHQMDEPEEGRRCWTQHYADGAQFHVDTLPALPDAAHQRMLLQRRGFSTEWAKTAIAITDRDHPKFREITDDWPHSNPKGYANWFRSKMRTEFEARRRALALAARASIEEIPEYSVRTPLQSAIQILKRHRDMMFAERTHDKPISIVVTTLAAHGYQQEPTISGAIYGILAHMAEYVEARNGVAWIANPTDPAENFADRWTRYPERRLAFYEWLDQARKDFVAAAQATDRKMAVAALQPRFGKRLMDAVESTQRNSLLPPVSQRVRGLRSMLNPAHRKSPPWRRVDGGVVRIERAILKRNGFRTKAFKSDGDALPKHCELTFEAVTDIPTPYEVYWQVVNTGREAEAANGLRGGFDEGVVTDGTLTRRESTLYSGTHSTECFIVKQGYLAAQSGQFIVNINGAENI